MDKNDVISRLKRHRAELEADGAIHVSLFGSVARGEDDENSDIDVVVQLSEQVRLSGFGYFGALASMKRRIEKITGRPVDIVSEPIENDNLRHEIERDRAVAF